MYVLFSINQSYISIKKISAVITAEQRVIMIDNLFFLCNNRSDTERP